MTKNQFLSKLHNELLWQYNKQEIEEILEDYNELFESGIEAGETEEILCQKLGSPKEVAAAIKDKKKPFLNKRSLSFFLLLTFLSMTVVIWHSNYYISFSKTIFYSLFFSIVIPIFLWTLFGGRFHSLPYVSNIEVKKELTFMFFVHFLFIIIEFIFYFVLIDVANLFYNKSIFFQNTEKEMVGPILYIFLILFYIILLFVLIIDFFLFIKKSIKFFPYICLIFGIGSTIFCIETVLKQLNDPNFFVYQISLSFFPLISIIVTLSFYYLIKKISKKENALWMNK